MAALERILACVTYVLGYITFSPFKKFDQTPLPLSHSPSYHAEPNYPVFRPPGRRISDDPFWNFTCEYPTLVGWRSCSTAENRTCWLRNDQTGEEYNIRTNYEDTNKTPFGIHRTYTLNITNGSINADGMIFEEGKFFNGTYPGPWIQGCWGDVRPKLRLVIVAAEG
jgi:hypothetical protein